MELRQLRYFATVVEAGSLTSAAAELHMSQPPLSVAIAKLESELGVSLLVRTSRGVEPTSAGRYLLEASSRILGEVDEMVGTLARFGAGAVGALTLAVVPVLTWERLPRLLRAFAADAPTVEVRVVDPPPWTAIDLLVRRRVDAAGVLVTDGRRFLKRHEGSFDALDWGTVPLVAALPPEDAPAEGETLPLSWFEGRTVLLPQRTAAVPSLPEAVEAVFQRRGVAPGAIRTVDTIQNCLPLIEAGLGVAILPDPDGESLQRFRIAVRPLDPAPPPLRALMLLRPGAMADPLLRGLAMAVAASAS